MIPNSISRFQMRISNTLRNVRKRSQNMSLSEIELLKQCLFQIAKCVVLKQSKLWRDQNAFLKMKKFPHALNKTHVHEKWVSIKWKEAAFLCPELMTLVYVFKTSIGECGLVVTIHSHLHLKNSTLDSA